MKFGCCVSMCGTAADPAGLRYLPAVVEAGFDYVELPIAEIMQLRDEEFEQLLRQLSVLGIRCESCNNLFPASVRLTGAARDDEQIQNYLHRAMDRVQALGARRVVFGSASAKNVPAGYPMDAAWQQIAQELLWISDAAQRVDPDIQIAIEPVCHRESNILHTYAEGFDMAETSRRSNVRCLVDYYHLSVEQEPLEDVLKGGTRLCHVHISNPNGRIYPCADDGQDYAGFFAALRHAGYDERVSVEAYTENFKEDAARALACLRSLI